MEFPVWIQLYKHCPVIVLVPTSERGIFLHTQTDKAKNNNNKRRKFVQVSNDADLKRGRKTEPRDKVCICRSISEHQQLAS